MLSGLPTIPEGPPPDFSQSIDAGCDLVRSPDKRGTPPVYREAKQRIIVEATPASPTKPIKKT